jgi:hypothetical protein
MALVKYHQLASETTLCDKNLADKIDAGVKIAKGESLRATSVPRAVKTAVFQQDCKSC